MLFQNPALLWGMLTVAVPIALHFWHQQRAKPMPWAMLRWIEMPNQPPKRGFRFDNWLLLLLRCLLLMVLSLLLARPTFDQKSNPTTNRRVHLVEPGGTVVQAYRFELEQALARQERVVWATSPLTPVTSLTDVPTARPLNPLSWQTAINELARRDVPLHTYLTNGPAWTDAPRLHVPVGFVLHPTDVPAGQTPPRYIALPLGKRLTTNADRRLMTVVAGSGTSGRAVAAAPLRVLLHCRRADERATVRAALTALTTVYGLTYLIDSQPVNDVDYAWVLTDQPVSAPKSGLYTLIGQLGDAHAPNVRYMPDVLTPQTSELVANGQLPELLAGQLADHLGLSAGPASLNRAQLADLFVADQPAVEAGMATAHPQNAVRNGLLVLFLSLLLAERYVAIRRGL